MEETKGGELGTLVHEMTTTYTHVQGELDTAQPRNPRIAQASGRKFLFVLF